MPYQLHQDLDRIVHTWADRLRISPIEFVTKAVLAYVKALEKHAVGSVQQEVKKVLQTPTAPPKFRWNQFTRRDEE